MENVTQKINLAGHIARSKSAMIYQCCKKLFATTCINYFCYLRRYKDGTFTFLPSLIDIGSYLFEDAVYPHSWIAGISFDALMSGYFYSDIAKQTSNQETVAISQTLFESFQISASIEVIEKHDDYCDFYSFASDNADIYFIPIQALYQFIFYFKQEQRSIILNAYDDRLTFYNQGIAIPSIPIIPIVDTAISNMDKEYDHLAATRYYLTGEYDDVFLTRREVDILKKMGQGGSVKCLASALNISPRTFEHHVTNIKNKLRVSRASEILHIARINRIII